MKYNFIARHQQKYPVKTLCRVLEVSVNSYCCAGYLGHPFEKNGILCMIDQVSLPKHVRCEYN